MTSWKLKRIKPKNMTVVSKFLPSISLAIHLNFSEFKVRGEGTSKNVRHFLPH